MMRALTHIFSAVTCVMLSARVAAAPMDTAGFQGATIVPSAAGEAMCIIGDVPVAATTTMNSNLLYAEPANQSVVTETFVELVEIDSPFMNRTVAGMSTVGGTFNINAKLCFPASGSAKALIFLIHGIGFDKSYWDFTPGYSFVDVAAAAGYATFTYDRLGVGLSDHPDPIQTVQSPLEVEIAHTMIQMLRNGAFGGQSFDKIVGGGHSFGSVQSVGVTSLYPSDLDAVILTGFSASNESIGITEAAWNSAIANVQYPARFGNLPNGYLITASMIGDQFVFLRAPNFSPQIAAMSEATKQTYTIGEIFTLSKVVMPVPGFAKPVFVLNGENDLIYCQADCTVPTNLAAVALSMLYPNAAEGSGTYLIPYTGHGINLHYSAPTAFQQMLNFVQSSGF